ncbi:MAG: asparagine--tRNA ligase, partial [Parcubacteria group bacterium]|nr:asparagine--tRNA ligase [Parcubacteria group bacterium]
MVSVRLDSLSAHVDEEVRVPSWVGNIRSSGKVVFLQLRDGYGWAQAVFEKESVSPDVWERAAALTLESSVVVLGRVVRHPKRDEYEIRAHDLTVVQQASEYPIGKKEHGIDFLMDLRHLWLRSPRQWAILRVRNTLISSIYQFMDAEGFVKIDAPILTPNACEGTSELFAIDYFNQKAYLSQSGQLYLEAAIFSHNRVFDFGPVFRAEKSKTRRHLTEFWMMDAEMAYATHEDNMALQERFVTHLVKRVLATNTRELAILERDAKPLEKIRPPFVRKTHAEVVAELQRLGSDINDADDLGGDDETLITKQYDRPLIVEKYPAAVKAFYMKRDPKNSSLALCNDMLAPEGYGEIIGGSQREDDYETLQRRIQDHGLPLKDFTWYLDLRRYGSVPHAGF